MSHAAEHAVLAERVAAFVREATGRAIARVDLVPPGLDTRRFFRVTFSGGQPATAVARVEGPAPDTAAGVPPEPPLEPIRALLEASGLPVPARYAGDARLGVELLEDVGDVSLEQVATAGPATERRRLYAEAVSLVPRLQRVSADADAVPAFRRRLDAALIATKARKWLEWAIPGLLGRDATGTERDATGRAFSMVAEAVGRAPARLAHRDFKAANLHVVGAGAEARLVMIDLQGAFLAPPEYDLVCLLRDSHVRLPEDEVQDHLTRVRPSLPDAPEPDELAWRFDLLTLVRVAKDVAHYVHAARERGDRRYLRLVPTGLANLGAAAARAGRHAPAIRDFAATLEALPEHLAGSTATRPDPARDDPAEGGPACGR